MENHPIPQDVTGFKFKLIGSITVKQFLYLVGGGSIALIIYLLPGSITLKLPLMLVFFGFGASFAFLPIEGRPMDIMITNFLKTLPSENKYIYKKRGANLAMYDFLLPPKQIAPIVSAKDQEEQKEEAQKRSVLINSLNTPSDRPDEGEIQFLRNIKNIFDDPNVIKTADNLQKENLEEKIRQEEESAHFQQQAPEQPEENVTQEAEQIKSNQIITEDANPDFAQEIANISRSAAQEPAAPAQNPDPSENMQARTGFPSLPDIPNVVLGIVRDPRGKVLPNILVEIVNQNGVPVRAFKTNALGQFASATPLPAGTYRLILEDNQKVHEFSPIEIQLANQIFMPLEIFSVDQREKLRQDLFGALPISQQGAAAN